MSRLARSKQSFGELPQMNDKIGPWTGMFFMEIVYRCLFYEGNG
jgi:hypothetical protein